MRSSEDLGYCRSRGLRRKIVKIQFHDFHQLISSKRLNILSLLQREMGAGLGWDLLLLQPRNENDFDFTFSNNH